MLEWRRYDTYDRRFCMAQLLWIVLAMVLPFVNAAAGIIPLFFPSLSIKLINILGIIKAKPNL